MLIDIRWLDAKIRVRVTDQEGGRRMKVQFDPSIIGKSLPEEYHVHEDFKIFRYAELKKTDKKPEAWFIVKFTLKHMDVKKNRYFSLLPMLALIHFKGFYSKYWLMNEKTNTCMGVYRWKTRLDAERYAKSIAMKFMTKRSIPDSVKYEIGEGEQPICAF